MRILVAVCLLLLINTSYGQELHFEDIPFSFYSTSRQQFVVISGDQVYVSKGVGKPWEVSTMKFGSGMTAQQLRAHYFPMNTAVADYFVMGGCGMVWEWKGDSLFRIDHSFDHKNQYGSSPFVYHDTLFMTGGYGFFQTKNITTYFDRGAGSWFLKHTKGEYPPDRCSSYHFQGLNEVYFWGGQVRNTLGDDTIRTLWSLDLSTGIWKDQGRLNPELQLPYVRGAYFNTLSENWVHLGGRLLQFFPDQNRVDEYYSDRFYQIRSWVPNEEDVLILEWRHDRDGVFALISKKEDYLGGVKRSFEMQNMSIGASPLWTYLPQWIYGLMILILAIYQWKIRGVRLEKLHEVDQGVKWQLSETELGILIKFLDAGTSGVEVSELNDFFNYGDPNFDTLKKRRELKLKELRAKLAHNSGIEESKIFIEERLSSDRRVKKLMLNPQIKRENLGIHSI